MGSDLRGNASILVVEDNPDLNMAVCEILQSYGFRVSSATNGADALEQIKRLPPDAVLCDIMMPGMDGYQAIQAIRGMEGFKHLPIIALTAKAMKADRDRCIEAGASDYISKPLDVDQLLSLLRVWLYHQEETPKA